MDDEEKEERRGDEEELELIEKAFEGRLVIGVPREGQEHEEDEEEEAEMKWKSGLIGVGICGGGASGGSHGRRRFERRLRKFWFVLVWEMVCLVFFFLFVCCVVCLGNFVWLTMLYI